MGHSRIGTLPATKRWKAVVAMIASGASASQIAAQTARAAEQSLRDASTDPALQRAAWLLARVPLASREDDFVQGLRRLGLAIDNEPTLFDICSAITMHLDDMMLRNGRPNDFGEIAQLSLVESFTAILGSSMPGLPGITNPADDVRVALHGLSTMKQFGILARDFFARLIRHCLDYYLSRELPNHVGVGQRFPSVRERRLFDEALELHCRETALIVKQFAGEWFSKNEYQGGIDQVKASGFAHHAFTKIVAELSIRSGELRNAA